MSASLKIKLIKLDKYALSKLTCEDITISITKRKVEILCKNVRG